MNTKKFILSALPAALLGLGSHPASAGPFSAAADINGNSASATGTNPLTGYVADGGFDAFDTFGYYANGLPGSIALQRSVDLLADANTYRWVDTFTNTGASAFSGQVRFFGSLGSDGATVISASTGYFKVSYEHWIGAGTGDPVLALVNGNNAWALSNTAASIALGDYRDDITLNLAPGQSISVAHFAILVRPDNTTTYYDATASIAAANTLATALVADPGAYWSGLSGGQIAQIANFSTATPKGVPEPAGLALLGAGLGSLIGARRGR